MGPLTDFAATPVAEYLRLEAPRELERLESIDRLLTSWPQWSTGEESALRSGRERVSGGLGGRTHRKAELETAADH
jgi:hypothetical protein